MRAKPAKVSQNQDSALRRPPGRDLTPTQRTVNRALSAARAPVERGVARLKSWRIFRRARCKPESNDVNRRGSPHPGAAVLKRLTVQKQPLGHTGRTLQGRRKAV